MASEAQSDSVVASVVVATKNRSERLARLLDALERQDGPPFELLIVDDGSTDATSSMLSQRLPRSPLRARVIRNETSAGQASARNTGWRATTTPIVIFTDDDCVPVPNWVASLVGALEPDRADVVSGVTTYPEDQAALKGLWSYWMEDDGEDGHFSTCNVGYRREVLETVGGLDERFQYQTHSAARCMVGDDTDLGWSAIEAGYRATTAPAAVVHHDVFPQRWSEYLKNMRRLGGLPLLFKKHPQLRDHWRRRVIYRTEDLSALAMCSALAGLAIGRKRTAMAMLGLAGAAWHVWVYTKYKPAPPGPGGYWAAIPLGAVADAYAAAVMLRASARYRTLLV